MYGKASVKIDYMEETLIIEFSYDRGAWRISGGSYTDNLLKKYTNPETEDTRLLMIYWF